MRRRRLAAFVIAAGAAAATGTPQAVTPPYLDPERPLEARVADLIARMTLQGWPSWRGSRETILAT